MITLFNIRPKGFNVGNDAINMGMQYYLYKAFGDVVNIIHLPATSRYESHASAGLTKRTIYEINQYGDGVIIGGGNLYENGEIEVDLDSLNTLDVPLMIFSVSWGRIYNRRLELVTRTDVLPDRIIIALNQKAQLSLSRDFATHVHLENIGVENSVVGGCPTIFLNRTVSRLPELPDNKQIGVLISVRNPALMNIPLSIQSQVPNDIRRIVSFLQSKGEKRIRLLCHDHRDIGFAASFGDLEYVYTGDVYSYLAMLKSCTLNISYRLHSALPCLSYGRPMIKISYDERAISLMDTIGYDDWNIKMIEESSVIDAVVDRYNRLDQLSSLNEEKKRNWENLDLTMFSAFNKFADMVVEQKEFKNRK